MVLLAEVYFRNKGNDNSLASLLGVPKKDEVFFLGGGEVERAVPNECEAEGVLSGGEKELFQGGGMVIQLIEPVGFAANCYLVSADGKHAVAIDPGEARVLAEAQKRGLSVTHVLLTHGHFDHIGGCAALQAAGVKIGCPKDDLIEVQHANVGARLFGMPPVASFTPDFTYEGGETLELDGITFRVIATPGHTKGSVCLLAEDVIFSGDTLFQGSVGRTDLPGGDFRALEKSVKALYALEGDYTVYPGHGEKTALSLERKYNGVIRC